MLLAESMGARREVTRLRFAALDLVEEYRQIRDRSAALDARSALAENLSAGVPTMTDGPAQAVLAEIHRLRRETSDQWEALVRRVRARPGLEDFEMPPPIDDLLVDGETGMSACCRSAGWRSSAPRARRDC